uniref:Fe2OG dioxygenase domain-containing protein n=1 Tax=Oryza glaberrima TaxID=4538 RepID=I1QID3_ORYGL
WPPSPAPTASVTSTPSTTPRPASRASSTPASPPSPTSSATTPTPSPSPRRRRPPRPSLSSTSPRPTSTGDGWSPRDVASKVRFNSNFGLFRNGFRSPAANWRDTMFVEMFPEAPSPEEIPPPCRGVLEVYAAAVRRLGERLFELLSEALGLPVGYLGRDAGCMDGLSLSVAAHYYPACPEPEATMGATKHSDPSFLTVLLQDTSGGLQAVLPRPPEERWVDVPPVAGALVVNVGDLLQLVSNDRLRSVEHRVLPTGAAGPARVSVACFFRHAYASTRPCVPVVVGGGGARAAAVYRSTTAGEFLAHYNGKGLDGRSALDHFRLPAAASSPPPPL